jgi:GDSL-like Lipase/Acylhydrolase family
VANRLLVVLGDSVTWGQGHLDQNKFVNIVAGRRRLTVRTHAHSGATIGVGDVQEGPCQPEAPNHYPTILQQLVACTDDPSQTDLVVIDGGINDISVETILNPFTSDNYLRNVTRRYCHDDIVTLVKAVLAKFPDAVTRIVVTGYFPIFSPKSDFDQVPYLLAARGIAPPPMLDSSVERKAFTLRSVDLAMLFWQESRAQLARAVASVGSNRVFFADVPFTEDNAMFASMPWLWNVHFHGGRLVPEDDVISSRHQECVLCHLHQPFKVPACDIASAGHPNTAGSDRFAETILDVTG